MGLDMYLRGSKFLWRNWNDPEAERQEDGYRITDIRIDLGYWRKHPNLHGYIVEAFASGNDNCQEIELSVQDMRNIISAIKEQRLPFTEGFFFGQSNDSEEQRKLDVAIFEQAIEWLEAEPKGQPPKPTEVETGVSGMTMLKIEVEPGDNSTPPRESRSVIYQASW